jgi:hypothetical protein
MEKIGENDIGQDSRKEQIKENKTMSFVLYCTALEVMPITPTSSDG